MWNFGRWHFGIFQQLFLQQPLLQQLLLLQQAEGAAQLGAQAGPQAAGAAQCGAQAAGAAQCGAQAAGAAQVGAHAAGPHSSEHKPAHTERHSSARGNSDGGRTAQRSRCQRRQATWRETTSTSFRHLLKNVSDSRELLSLNGPLTRRSNAVEGSLGLGGHYPTRSAGSFVTRRTTPRMTRVRKNRRSKCRRCRT